MGGVQGVGGDATGNANPMPSAIDIFLNQAQQISRNDYRV